MTKPTFLRVRCFGGVVFVEGARLLGRPVWGEHGRSEIVDHWNWHHSLERHYGVLPGREHENPIVAGVRSFSVAIRFATPKSDISSSGIEIRRMINDLRTAVLGRAPRNVVAVPDLLGARWWDTGPRVAIEQGPWRTCFRAVNDGLRCWAPTGPAPDLRTTRSQS